jgi:uncharacterized membrane protein YidH (DUF202 family)
MHTAAVQVEGITELAVAVAVAVGQERVERVEQIMRRQMAEVLIMVLPEQIIAIMAVVVVAAVLMAVLVV